jgi:hypothetical protein
MEKASLAKYEGAKCMGIRNRNMIYDSFRTNLEVQFQALLIVDCEQITNDAYCHKVCHLYTYGQ